MVPFGAAASPDLTILPVFLAATTAGVARRSGHSDLRRGHDRNDHRTYAGGAGSGYEIRGQWLERWGNVFTAIVLVVIGALVLTGTI